MQVTMTGFKTLKHAGIAVSPGDRVALAATDPRSRRRDRNRERHRRVAADPVAAPASAPSPVDDRWCRTCRSATAASRADRVRARRRVAATNRAGSAAAARTTRMMDGVSTMDTGNNPPVLFAQHRSDRGSEGADLGLSGRVRPGERPADHRRHQERHQPVPRLGLRRRPRLRLERQQLGEQAERQRRRRSTSRTTGAIPSAARSASPGGGNKLFFFFSQEWRPRTTAGGRSARFRFPTALERAGDFSQTLDNNGNVFTLIRDAVDRTCPARPPTPPAVISDGGVVGRFRQSALYQTGLNILQAVPDAEHHTAAGLGYNYEETAPAIKHAQQPAGHPRRLPADPAAAHDVQVRRRDAAAADVPGHDSRASTTSRRTNPVITTIGADGQLHPESDDVHRGELRADARTRWPAARRSTASARKAVPMSAAGEQATTSAWATCRSSSRTASGWIRATTSTSRSTNDARRRSGRTAQICCRRRSPGATASPTRRRTSPYPAWLNINRTPGRLDQPDEGRRAGTR